MAKTSAKVPSEFSAHLREDLSRLDAVVAGLGKRAEDYILTGHPAAVVLELTTHKDEIHKALYGNGYVSYFGHGQEPDARTKCILASADVPPHVLQRYAEAMQPIYPMYWGSDDSKYVDTQWVRWWLITTHSASMSVASDNTTRNNAYLGIWSVSRVRACLEAAGAAHSVTEELYGNKGYFWPGLINDLKDLKEHLAGNHDAVVSAAGKVEAQGRVRLIEDLSRFDLAKGSYLGFVFREAVGTAKGPAKVARAALYGAPLTALAALAEPVFAAKDSSARRGAAEVLALVGGLEAIPLLKARQDAETSQPLRDAVAALMAQVERVSAPTRDASSSIATGVVAPAGSVVLAAIDGSSIVIPPVPPPPADTPIARDALDGLRKMLPAYNAAVAEANKRRAAEHKEKNWTWPLTEEPQIEERQIDEVLEFLNGKHKTKSAAPLFSSHSLSTHKLDRNAAEAVFTHPTATLWHALRMAMHDHGDNLHLLTGNPYRYFIAESVIAEHLAKPTTDHRTVIAMIGALKGELDTAAHVRSLMTRWGGGNLDDLAPSMQHHLLQHLEVFEEAFGVRPAAHAANRYAIPDETGAVWLLARLDKIPERLLQPLLAVALTGKRPVRADARKLLATAKDIDDAIIARLADAKKETRASAAQWLAERATPGAAAPLAKALKNEKAEQPRAAMLSALARLGEDISAYFDEKALRKEAEAGLAKATTKSLEWFPFAAMPHLRWAGGKTIPTDVVKWWVVLADKLKDPAGNAMFELYLDRAEKTDAEAFGLFLLRTFIDRDTTSCSEAEAIAYAEQAKTQHAAWVKQYSANNPEFKDWTTPDAVFRSSKIAKLNEHIYSGADNKGILGLAVRAPGSEAAAITRQYVKNHGSKVSQTKALLASLARNPAPSAIQVVLSVSNRVKQKTVQAYAGELIAEVADRRGWSPDELADRTVPTGGLDESGELDLDFGDDRAFTAVYRGEGTVELLNAVGKAVKSPPTARHDGEKERVDAAKKLLTTARKEVKQTETAQRDRLYEAMCVERRWPLELWTSCLKVHPIVGRHVQRLVWQGLDEAGDVAATFRVLDDGTGTNTDDDTVALDGFASVRLAHRALLDAKAAKAWAEHMKDYEVAALFPQLDRPLHALDAKRKAETAIEERKGWMIESLKLKSIATKLGYQTGDVGDGGSYMDYVKRFNGAGIAISIGFTGSYMGAGAEVIPTALTDLAFQKIGRGGRVLKLGDVPGVLLSEAIADLHAIAAAGSGFDAGWEKKAMF